MIHIQCTFNTVTAREHTIANLLLLILKRFFEIRRTNVVKVFFNFRFFLLLCCYAKIAYNDSCLAWWKHSQMQICAMKCAGIRILFCVRKEIAIIISHIFLFLFLGNLIYVSPFAFASCYILASLWLYGVYDVQYTSYIYRSLWIVHEDTQFYYTAVYSHRSNTLWSCWWKRVKFQLKNVLRKESCKHDEDSTYLTRERTCKPKQHCFMRLDEVCTVRPFQ